MNSSKNLEQCANKGIFIKKHTQNTVSEMLDNLQTSSLCALDSPKDQSFTNINCCEQQIDFLNQCKSALSSEVVRWKSESHKLQKEKEKIEKEREEIKAMMHVISQSNAQLEKQLSHSIQENERLKMHALAIGEENSFLHTRLTKSLSKFHSYPWPTSNSNPNKKSNFSSSLSNKEPFIFQNRSSVHSDVSYSKSSESWEEVSQKLLMQMKQEMKELQELNSKLTLQTSINDGSELSNKSTCLCDLTCSSNDQKIEQFAASCDESNERDLEYANYDETLEMIEDLKSNMVNLKQVAQNQNITMQKLLLQFLTVHEFGAHCISENEDAKKDELKCLKSEMSTSCSQDNTELEKLFQKRNFTRPSDESFRAYFTQQLHGGKISLEEKAGHNSSKTNVVSKSDTKNTNKNVYFLEDKSSEIKNEASVLSAIDITRETNKPSSSCDKMFHEASLPRKNMPECSTTSKSTFCTNINPTQKLAVQYNQKKNIVTDDERICPMCQAVFPKIVSQHEFETHVVSHFESESGSLLEQYEVI